MTTTWATQKLPADIYGNVVLIKHSDGSSQGIDPESFSAITANITDADATHATLIASTLVFSGAQVSPSDAGWQQYFDWWRAQGYIN